MTAYSLSSTNIDQSAPNLVKMYLIRSRMSSIMDLIAQELSELSALEFENLPYLTVSSPEHNLLKVSYCNRSMSGVCQ